MLLALCASLGAAQTCGLAGWNGPLTASGVINAYYAGTGAVAAGASSITVASTTGQRTNTHVLVAGDMILIMQMQDSAVAGNSGLHEYAQVVGVAGATLSLNRPLTNSYNQTMNNTNVRNWQAVWVPQYSALTITASVTADRWTITTAGAATGGVVAFDVAGSLALNGTVTVAGMGFRGAMGLNGSAIWAAGTATTANSIFTPTSVATIIGGQKGEGTQGTPPVVFNGTVAGSTYTVLLGQGYALGAGGQAAIGNAGGGANNGLNGDNNNFNAGGGGGSNAGAGGQGGNSWNSGTNTSAPLNQNTLTDVGNVAGGKGGTAIANSSTRLVMGGGGGSGGANNATADVVTLWPPSPASFPPPNNAVVANGASGAVTSSGASGGGVVLIRAGSISSTAGKIDASGYQAYNKSLGGDTDAGGGGGGGGSVFITAGSGNGAGLTINALGGAGGSSNYFNHGPGGGGGGGYIATNLGGITPNINGATNGIDACCGAAGTNLGTNGSPKAWNATAGANGATAAAGAPAGVQSGASCLPLITVTKSTLTPTLTSAPGATASYSIKLSNSGGAASNLFIFDTLPPGWAYTAATAPTYTYSPAPPPAANSPASGAETTSAGTPGALPVSTVATANSVTAVSLRAAGAAPGVAPATGAVTPTFGSFYLPQNGVITVSFLVTIPATATAGTYHNPAGVIFLDPTRVTTAVRMLSPLTDVNSNRAGVNYSANTTYASGSSTNVLGSNYNGLQGGPTGDDVQLLPDFSVTKTASASSTPGRTISYTITARNSGWAIGSYTYAATQATDVSTANVPLLLGSNPLTVTDTLPAGVTLNNVFTGTNWTCTGTSTQVCTLPNANAYPIAASTDFAAITGTVTLSLNCTGATTRTNTATVSPAFGEVNASNNTATATTTVSCVTANLQVTKTNNLTTVTSGGTTSYTVTLTNLGPSAAPLTTVTDVATGLTCTTVTCAPSSGLASCPAASMPFVSLTTGIVLPTFGSGTSVTLVISCGISATGF
ncbi:MAG: DUF11 domain-containing protein [Burkholderiales bacterium]|nr:DUF11 domain-containing protein [Burkholderiales bacterium]